MSMSAAGPLRVGIGGPVGSGKTALTLGLCRALRDRYELAVVTNDIYTEEDAQFLVRHEALAAQRIGGVFIATGPSLPFGETLERIAAALGADVRLVWVDDATLLARGVEPWMELPVWMPQPKPTSSTCGV